MRKLITTVILLACIVLTAQAQLKPLTADQMLKGNTKGIIETLPKVGGWKDDTHYILYKPLDKGFDTVLVDAVKGTETPYTAVADAKASVAVKNNDIVFTAADGSTKQLTHNKDEEKNATLSPDGSKVAFTRNNDLYVIDIATDTETRLTSDATDVIYNGWASWVYFEEILGRASKYKAFWWNPDSKHIAFMHFDDTKVPMFPLYGADGQHGYVENTRYPQPGDTNPAVKMGIVDISTQKTVWADFNENDDQYFGTPYWSPDGGSLWMQWMNRNQNHLIVYAVNPADGNKAPIYDEQQKSWVSWLGNINFLQNNKGFIIQTDKSGWSHLYQYDMKGNLVKQITNGDWTVKDLLRIDEAKGQLYFTARKENSTRFDLYTIKIDGTKLQRLSFGEYSHAISLSTNASYFISTYSNVSTPTQMALLDTKGKLIKQLADSKGADFNNYAIAKTELLRVNTPDGYALPVTITWPVNMDSSKKYPVLISIYGGPNAGTVYDGWKGVGQNQWWAKEGLIQVAIDHRGSGHFGKLGQDFMYKNLGTWEIADYTEVVKWLTAKPFIDKNKIAITGFSYGGYVTCMALTKGAGYFTHGIAGGSVTDWALYDSHYAERFMGLPKDNPEGYKNGAVATYLKNYTGNLLIVHGTMDDNVHMQNSIQLISALEDAKKPFEMMFYPGGRHGWSNLKEKNAHFNNEKTKYYYQYLLEKPVPAEILQ
ncbi:S9 family peptidase [Limnovirga soli]|uniref:Prolyl oligopeptidase family serine peptidase n=1 Tax=Limnovirga soli TaxID=2656915 RepID=A0A8J8FE71_9BACT|nr:S9 family peptidase [Limnovirga soli]NNV56080.1 prolyl oligopeptidase family serine peptidase [Limnovirga soli]